MIQGYAQDQTRRGLLPSTVDKRTRSIRRWVEYVGDPWAATPEDVERFLDSKHLSARTRYWWVSCLHGFYAWAIRAGHTDRDPTANIARPRLRRTLPRPISDADLGMAIRMAPPMIRAWICLGALSGLRCIEISRLDREHILESHDPPMIRVLGKGDKERMVPLHPDTWDALRALGLPKRGPLFTGPHGVRLSATVVSRRGSEFFDSVGIPATMHQLRHWFGTRTYQATKDLRTVQELLGHASPSVTAIYTAWDQASGVAAVGRLRLPA